MPQLDLATFASQIFWLGIVFATLYFLMSQLALPQVREVLHNRKTRISNDLAKAEALKNEALEAEKAYQVALAEAKNQARKLLEETHAAIKQQEHTRYAQINETFTRQIKEFEHRVTTLRKEAEGNFSAASVGITQEIIRKLVGISLEKEVILAELENQQTLWEHNTTSRSKPN